MDAEEIMDQIKQLQRSALRNAKPLFNEQVAKYVAAIIVDLQSGIIVHSTDQADKLFGADLDEGKKITDLMPERFRINHDKHFQSYVKHPAIRPMGETSMQLYGLHSDGTEFRIEISLCPMDNILDGRYVIGYIFKTKI